jgi:hypothetical protein
MRLAIVAALCLCFSHSLNALSDQLKGSEKKINTDKPQKTKKNDPRGSLAGDRETEKPHGGPQEDNCDVEKRIYKVNIGGDQSPDWTGRVSVGIALLALFFVWQQVWVMRTSERAWIMITPAKTEQGEVPTVFRGAVRNAGKTPARILETAVRYQPIENLSVLNKKPDYSARQSRNGMIIIPTDSFPLDVDTRSLGKVQYVYGVVVYRDAYGKRRETQFGFVYKAKTGWEIGGPETYNKAT